MDEIPDLVRFLAHSLPRSRGLIAPLVEAREFVRGLARLTPATDPEAEAITRLGVLARNNPPDDGQAPFQELASALLDPDTCVLVLAERWHDLLGPREQEGEIDFSVVITPARFATGVPSR